MIPAGIFVEILVVGLLILAAISPLLLAVWPTLASKWQTGASPIANAEIIAIAFLLIYPLGVLGNRVADDVFELVIDDTFLELKVLRDKCDKCDKWDKGKLKKEVVERGEDISVLKKKKIYKVAEARVMQRGGASRAWLERHKSFVRLLRGAAFSALLFLLGVGVYKLVPGLQKRYSWKLSLAVLLVFTVMFVAWRVETYGYQDRVVLLYLYGEPSAKAILD